MKIWTLTNYLLADLPSALIAIGVCKPFVTQGSLGYLNHTLSMILGRLGKEITGGRGERVLISTNKRWKTPWVLLYGLGEREGLTKEKVIKELLSLQEDLIKLKMGPVAYTLPGYDPYGWGNPITVAQLLVDTVKEPGFIVSTNKRLLYRIYYRVKGTFTYMLRE